VRSALAALNHWRHLAALYRASDVIAEPFLWRLARPKVYPAPGREARKLAHVTARELCSAQHMLACCPQLTRYTLAEPAVPWLAALPL